MKTRAALAGALLALVAGAVLGAADDAEKLERLRGRLSKLESAQSTATDQRGKVTQQLRRDERRIGEAAGALARAERELKKEQGELDRLRAEQAAQQGRVAAQRGALAAQLRAAFAGGGEQRVKLLLNMEDPSRVGRMLAYHSRLNRARSERIEALDAALVELTRLGHEVETRVEALAGATAARRSALAELTAARDARRASLKALDAEIAKRGGELNRVRREAERLTELLESIGDVFADAPFEDASVPFAKQRGKLPWPLTGRVLARYGQPRAEGKLKWEGLLIASSAGAPVRAVASGRIAYADWLPFYGMLVIVEHGDGYLSLYGHNQALTKQAGEWVKRGETIALSGDSGGQSRAALYFELRRGKSPQDPSGWLARR